MGKSSSPQQPSYGGGGYSPSYGQPSFSKPGQQPNYGGGGGGGGGWGGGWGGRRGRWQRPQAQTGAAPMAQQPPGAASATGVYNPDALEQEFPTPGTSPPTGGLSPYEGQDGTKSGAATGPGVYNPGSMEQTPTPLTQNTAMTGNGYAIAAPQPGATSSPVAAPAATPGPNARMGANGGYTRGGMVRALLGRGGGGPPGYGGYPTGSNTGYPGNGGYMPGMGWVLPRGYGPGGKNPPIQQPPPGGGTPPVTTPPPGTPPPGTPPGGVGTPGPTYPGNPPGGTPPGGTPPPGGTGTPPPGGVGPSGGYDIFNPDPADWVDAYQKGTTDPTQVSNVHNWDQKYLNPFMVKIGQAHPELVGQRADLWSLMNGAGGGLNNFSPTSEWGVPAQDMGVQKGFTGKGPQDKFFVNGHLFPGQEADFMNFWKRQVPQATGWQPGTQPTVPGR